MAIYYGLTHTISQFRKQPPHYLLRWVTDTQAPIDVEGLAKMIGIQVNRVKGLKWDGVIFRRCPAINVLKERSPERQRFTIAHGIGHILLHDGDEYREDFLTDSKEEREANRYAVNLLMPEHLILAQLSSPVIEGDAIEEMAKRFWVSRASMKFRLKELGCSCPTSAIERVAEEEFLG